MGNETGLVEALLIYLGGFLLGYSVDKSGWSLPVLGILCVVTSVTIHNHRGKQ